MISPAYVVVNAWQTWRVLPSAYQPTNTGSSGTPVTPSSSATSRAAAPGGSSPACMQPAAKQSCMPGNTSLLSVRRWT